MATFRDSYRNPNLNRISISFENTNNLKILCQFKVAIVPNKCYLRLYTNRFETL